MTRHCGPRTCAVDTCGAGGPRIVGDGAVICSSCTTRMTRAITALPAAYDDLGAALARVGAGPNGTRVSGTPNRPLPIRVEVADHRADIRGWLTAETTMWAAELPVTTPPAEGVDSAAAWLARLTHLARHREWAPCTHDAARALLGRAHALADTPRDRPRFPVGSCPDCATPHARVWAHIPHDPDASAYLACDTCSHTWPPLQWHSFGRRVGAFPHRRPALALVAAITRGT